jgi:hypothetical protein
MRTEDLIERPYEPPPLYIREEVEIGGGYHTLAISHIREEQDWSEPYQKSGFTEYRCRIVRVPYPPITATAPALDPKTATRPQGC